MNGSSAVRVFSDARCAPAVIARCHPFHRQAVRPASRKFGSAFVFPKALMFCMMDGDWLCYPRAQVVADCLERANRLALFLSIYLGVEFDRECQGKEKRHFTFQQYRWRKNVDFSFMF